MYGVSVLRGSTRCVCVCVFFLLEFLERCSGEDELDDTRKHEVVPHRFCFCH